MPKASAKEAAQQQNVRAALAAIEERARGIDRDQGVVSAYVDQLEEQLDDARQEAEAREAALTAEVATLKAKLADAERRLRSVGQILS